MIQPKYRRLKAAAKSHTEGVKGLEHEMSQRLSVTAPRGSATASRGALPSSGENFWLIKEQTGASLNNAERVRQFHRAVGNVDPPVPTPPDEAVLSLRRVLIEEESHEVLEAFARFQEALPDGGRELEFHALVHELTDLLYVTYGALVAFGVEPDGVFAEVHRANMQKAAGPRREDGKQLKPEGWRPADVAGVLAEQKRRR